MLAFYSGVEMALKFLCDCYLTVQRWHHLYSMDEVYPFYNVLLKSPGCYHSCVYCCESSTTTQLKTRYAPLWQQSFPISCLFQKDTVSCHFM